MTHSSHNVEVFSLSSSPTVKEVVYTPDSVRRQGWRIWGTMIRELFDISTTGK
jgi:hypothetical protein